jgi:hypothetical protein
MQSRWRRLFADPASRFLTPKQKKKENDMKGWRTLLVNSGVAAFGVLEATDWTALLGSDSAGWAVTGIAVANMVLRSITTTPVGKPS